MMTTIRRVLARLLRGSGVSPNGNPVHFKTPVAELGSQGFVRTTEEPATRQTARRIRIEAFEEGREPFDLMGEDW